MKLCGKLVCFMFWDAQIHKGSDSVVIVNSACDTKQDDMEVHSVVPLGAPEGSGLESVHERFVLFSSCL